MEASAAARATRVRIPVARRAKDVVIGSMRGSDRGLGPQFPGRSWRRRDRSGRPGAALDPGAARTYSLSTRNTCMTAKLTLTVDPDVIAAAKRYAAASGTSVSQLVEDYLAAISAAPAAVASPPVLARLRGSMRGADVADYQRHLVEKYG